MSTKKIGEVFNHPEDVRRYKDSRNFILNGAHIGVEVELEGFKKAPMLDHPAYWLIKEDNSLRQYDNKVPYEFVTSYYYCGEDLHDALNQLHTVINNITPPPIPSSRTSVHVHLDVRDLSLKQMYDLTLLYALYERVLFRFCDIQREDSIFCVPFYKANGLLQSLSATSLTERISKLPQEEMRYAAFNLHALKKFGSVEFRHHPGTLDMNKIRTWINIIMCLKQHVLNHRLVNEFYHNIEDLTRDVFREYVRYLRTEYFERDIKCGLESVQSIILKDDCYRMTATQVSAQQNNFFGKLPLNEHLLLYGISHKLFRANSTEAEVKPKFKADRTKIINPGDAISALQAQYTQLNATTQIQNSILHFTIDDEGET